MAMARRGGGSCCACQSARMTGHHSHSARGLGIPHCSAPASPARILPFRLRRKAETPVTLRQSPAADDPRRARQTVAKKQRVVPIHLLHREETRASEVARTRTRRRAPWSLLAIPTANAGPHRRPLLLRDHERPQIEVLLDHDPVSRLLIRASVARAHPKAIRARRRDPSKEHLHRHANHGRRGQLYDEIGRLTRCTPRLVAG